MDGCPRTSRIILYSYASTSRTVNRAACHDGSRLAPDASTFTTDPSQPDRWAKALQLNLITVNVAREYDLPVINFWQAARNLPSAGMSGDNAHLTTQSGSTIAFDGSENSFGFTMRNLVTLQALDAIRQGVGG